MLQKFTLANARAPERAERQLIVAPLAVRLNNRPSGTSHVDLLVKLYCGEGKKNNIKAFVAVCPCAGPTTTCTE